MKTIKDGFRSLIGNLGNPERDKSASVEHTETLLDDQQLNAAFSSNWIARKIVTLPAKDALKKGRSWSGESKQAIESEERRLGLNKKLIEALTMARLLGGAAIYIGTDQDPEDELLPDSIKQGDIKYLTVLTRRELSADQLNQDPMSKGYGKPVRYQVTGAATSAYIHPSRLILLDGDMQADKWLVAGANMGWGESVLKSTHDAIKNAGGTFANVASLVYEANIDVIGVPKLMANIGSEGYEKDILTRFGLASANKGINGTLILDGDEEYNRKGASFAQLPEVMSAFALHCAAAADIPATRFMGQSSSGLNSTGEGDLDNYYDMLAAYQTYDISPALQLFDECLVRSATGSYPEDAVVSWNPLKQMDEQEIAAIGKTTAESIKILSDTESFTGEEIREIAIHRLSEIGAFPHIKQVIEETESTLDLGSDDD